MKKFKEKLHEAGMGGGVANLSGNIAKTEKPLFSPADYAKQEREHAHQSEEIAKELNANRKTKKLKKHKKQIKEGAAIGGAMGIGGSNGPPGGGSLAASNSGFVPSASATLAGDVSRVGAAVGPTMERGNIKKLKKKKHHHKDLKESGGGGGGGAGGGAGGSGSSGSAGGSSAGASAGSSSSGGHGGGCGSAGHGTSGHADSSSGKSSSSEEHVQREGGLTIGVSAIGPKTTRLKKLKKKLKEAAEKSNNELQNEYIDNRMSGVDQNPPKSSSSSEESESSSEDVDERQDREIDQELKGEKVTQKKPKIHSPYGKDFDASLKSSVTNKNSPDTVDSAEIDTLNASKKEDFSGYKKLNEAEEQNSEYVDFYGPDFEIVKLPKIIDIEFTKIGEEEIPCDSEEEECLSSEDESVVEPEAKSEEHSKISEEIADLRKQIASLKDQFVSSKQDYPTESTDDQHFKDDIKAGFKVQKNNEGKYEVLGNKTNYKYTVAENEKEANDWLLKLNAAQKNPGAVKQDLETAKEKPQQSAQISQSPTPEQAKQTLTSSMVQLAINNKALLVSANEFLDKNIKGINEKFTGKKLTAKIIVEGKQAPVISSQPQKAIAVYIRETKKEFIKAAKTYLNYFNEAYKSPDKFASASLIKNLEEKLEALRKPFEILAYFSEAVGVIDSWMDDRGEDATSPVEDMKNIIDANQNIMKITKEQGNKDVELRELNPLKATCPACGSEAIGRDKEQSDDSCAWCVNGHKWNIKTGTVCGEVEIPSDYRNLVFKDGKFVNKDMVIGDNEEKIPEGEVVKSEEKQITEPSKEKIIPEVTPKESSEEETPDKSEEVSENESESESENESEESVPKAKKSESESESEEETK